MGYRGTEGLGILTVYVNPFLDCDVKCDGLACKEVPQLEVGVCWKSDGSGYDQDVKIDSGMGVGRGTVGDSGAVGQAN